MRKSIWFLPLLLSLTALVFAHENHDHKKSGSHEKVDAPLTLAAINSVYLQNIKPIFQKKCFDCHGGTTKFPWYYKIPGAKQLIDDDIEEAKEHMDMSKDFPFQGHGKPVEDLKEIAKVMRKNEMPPWRYWIIHWETRLTEEERRLILEWTDEGLELLQKRDKF